MIKQTSHEIKGLPGDIVDLDLTASGMPIGVTEYGRTQVLFFDDKLVGLPREVRFPIVAAIDERTALLVDSRTDDRENAWIVAESGDVNRSFFAGDAIESILASERSLVITYFDESAASSTGIEGQGLAVFDVEGNFNFGYRDCFGAEADDIVDCYCVCWSGTERVDFLPYTDFPFITFDLAERSQQKSATPSGLHGSHALSRIGSTVYFHSPYHDKAGIYKWTIATQTAERVGVHTGPLKSYKGGQFLAVGKWGFTIVDPTNQD